jgi:hypothetical protein
MLSWHLFLGGAPSIVFGPLSLGLGSLSLGFMNMRKVLPSLPPYHFTFCAVSFSFFCSVSKLQSSNESLSDAGGSFEHEENHCYPLLPVSDPALSGMGILVSPSWCFPPSLHVDRSGRIEILLRAEILLCVEHLLLEFVSALALPVSVLSFKFFWKFSQTCFSALLGQFRPKWNAFPVHLGNPSQPKHLMGILMTLDCCSASSMMLAPVKGVLLAKVSAAIPIATMACAMRSCCSPDVPGVCFARKHVGISIGPEEWEHESQLGGALLPPC